MGSFSRKVKGIEEIVIPEGVKFEVKDINDTVTLELPRLYYLGYDIKQITNNKTKKLNYNPGDKGFITFEVEENGIIKVDYTGTVLYKLSKVLKCFFSAL